MRSLTSGLWGPSRQVQLWRVAAPRDDDGLLHHIDAVTLHEVLQQVEDVLCPRALECKDAWGRWGSSEGPKTQYLCFPKDRCPIFLNPSLPASQLPPSTLHPGCSQLYPVSTISEDTWVCPAPRSFRLFRPEACQKAKVPCFHTGSSQSLGEAERGSPVLLHAAGL